MIIEKLKKAVIAKSSGFAGNAGFRPHYLRKDGRDSRVPRGFSIILKHAGSVFNSKEVPGTMKLSRRLRSCGAVFLCAVMVLCNIPLVQAADITISAPPIVTNPVCGNGIGPYGNCSMGPIGSASGNTITINGTATIGMTGTDDIWVYGGFATGPGVNANGNEIRIGGYATINNGDGDRIVIGGASISGNTNNNTVIIGGSATIQNAVVGGLSREYGTPSNNTVIVNGGTIGGDVTGGRIGDDNIDGTGNFLNGNNVVEINGGTIGGNVYGSRTVSGNITNNTSSYGVEISGGTIRGIVYDGFTKTANVEGSKVRISGGTVNKIVAGSTDLGSAKNNVVTVNGGLITDITAGQTTTGAAEGNIVNILGGSSDNIINGIVRAGHSTNGAARNNTINIDFGGIVTGKITGGESSYGEVRNNEVLMQNGTVSEIIGGTSQHGTVTGNEVVINGGAVDTAVIGGLSSTGAAGNNKVFLHGGTFSGQITGGQSTTGEATGNHVYIGLNAVLNPGTRLYGGRSGAGVNARSGNTLSIRKPITVAALDNFENFNFYLPADFAANQTMVTATNGNGSNDAVNLENANIEIGVSEGSSLKLGDTIILINSGRGINGTPANSTSDGSTLENSDGLINYRFGLKVNDNQLQANVLRASLDAKTNSLPDGYIGGVILANQGADAIAGAAMDSAMAVVHKNQNGQDDNFNGLGGFGSLVIGKSQYDLGSDLDMLGVSAAAGLAMGINFTNSSLTMGPFAEYGKGEYETVFSFDASGQEARGDGDSEYMGGGFLLRMDYKDTGAGRYFAEASMRAGRLKNNYALNWPDDNEASENFSYKFSAPYYGLHLGYGGSWDVAHSAALDIYGKYFFARAGSGSTPMSSGEYIDFDELTSSRIRGGARVAYSPAAQVSVSFGGAYEYEMKGEAAASMRSFDINAPSLKGGTGIGEVIVGFRPSMYAHTTINFGVQGYTGKRQGIAASVFVKF
jgi:hypothetical protein